MWAGAYWPAIWSTNSFFWASKGFWIEQDTLLWAPPRTVTDVFRLNNPWAFRMIASDSGGRHCPRWSLHWTLGLGYQPLELHRSRMPPSLKPSREMSGSEPNPGKAGVGKIRLTSRSPAYCSRHCSPSEVKIWCQELWLLFLSCLWAHSPPAMNCQRTV